MDRFIKQRLMETTNGGNNEDVIVLCCECGEEILEKEANKNSGYCINCLKEVE